MTSTTQIQSTPPVSPLPAWLTAMRPEHWIKNILLFVALPFSGQMMNPTSWLHCAWGFAVFCLLASGIYLLNDIRDKAADAMHPTKRYRPIASGKLSVPAAWVESILLAGLGMAMSVVLGPAFVLTAGAYVVLNLLYTYWLKHHAIIDVVILSLGFVLRAMASAEAIPVAVSAYLVLCTFMLCLFIALTKRRSEVNELAGGEIRTTRRVNVFYTPERTEHMLSVSAGLSIVTYSLYCVAPSTVARLGSANLVWTTPLVVYAMFRYYCLTGQAGASDPVHVLLHDKVLWIVSLLWALMVAGVVLAGKFGWMTNLLV